MRPRPDSSAKRVPTTTGVGRPVAATAVATVDRPADAARRVAPSANHAAEVAPAATNAATTIRPGASTTQSGEVPGAGSTSLAVPNGNHREATIAPAAPRAPPITPTTAGPAAAVTTACRGLMPNARSVCSSAVLAAA
ncbi:MAG: hypothetical protein DLM58_23020 [Pseudonocardiales bacterium]|nr:MAG: hypothetical protein DLM58_23020 [Pseudonocardiales bacterium]